MKILKVVGLVAGGALALIAVLLVAVAIFFDPNDYKEDIERLVQQRTGRELTLEGDLGLSIFPWLAIELGPATLSDAPGFGDEPFAAVEYARLSVRLWPLLRGRVEIGNVRLDGMTVRLITDAQGRSNWEDLAATEPAEDPLPAAEADSLSMPTIAGLDIRDASVVLEDRRDDSRLALTEFNMTTGRLASAEPFDLDSRFLLETSSELSVRTALEARVTADFERNIHVLDNLEANVVLLGSGYPQEGLPVTVTVRQATADIGREHHELTNLVIATAWRGPDLPQAGIPLEARVAGLTADLAAQTLTTAGLDVEVAGASLSGTLTGQEILDAPQLAGQLQLTPVSLREWLPRLGVEVPDTRDPAVLGPLSFDANVTLTPSSVELTDLVLRLDETTATGSFGLADFAAEAVRFDLQVDRIDADRYLAPEAEGEAGAEASTPFEIPVETLRPLNVRGTLAVAEAIFAGVRFTQLRLGVTARDGDLRLAPLEASVYGGQYRGEIAVAAVGDAARVTLDQRLAGIDFAPLFADLFDTQRLSGRGSFNARLNANGRDSQELLRTLNGTFDFNVAEGALEGADLWYEIRRARALFRQQAIPGRTGPARTEFTTLSGSGAARDGVFETTDLNLAMQYLRVTGRAVIDLPSSEIDSRLDATVLRIPPEGAETEGLQELVNARIPVRITGSLTDPSVRPDVEGYLKNRVQQRLEEEKEKVEERIRETLQDRLRRALGGN